MRAAPEGAMAGRLAARKLPKLLCCCLQVPMSNGGKSMSVRAPSACHGPVGLHPECLKVTFRVRKVDGVRVPGAD